MIKVVHIFFRVDNGTTAIEYALVASLIAVVIVGSVQAVGTAIMTTFYNKLAALF